MSPKRRARANVRRSKRSAPKPEEAEVGGTSNKLQENKDVKSSNGIKIEEKKAKSPLTPSLDSLLTWAKEQQPAISSSKPKSMEIETSEIAGLAPTTMGPSVLSPKGPAATSAPAPAPAPTPTLASPATQVSAADLVPFRPSAAAQLSAAAPIPALAPSSASAPVLAPSSASALALAPSSASALALAPSSASAPALALALAPEPAGAAAFSPTLTSPFTSATHLNIPELLIQTPLKETLADCPRERWLIPIRSLCLGLRVDSAVGEDVMQILHTGIQSTFPEFRSLTAEGSALTCAETESLKQAAQISKHGYITKPFAIGLEARVEFADVSVAFDPNVPKRRIRRIHLSCAASDVKGMWERRIAPAEHEKSIRRSPRLISQRST